MQTLVEEDAQGALDHPPERQRAWSGRPKDAASVILVDRSSAVPSILMGRRGSGHAFMPGLHVFPGGRRDPRDHALPFARDLHPKVSDRLLAASASRLTRRGARALALAALRELHEETGLRVTGPQDTGPQNTGRDDGADLSQLRYVARAITPPGNVRRFDTRFFLLPAEEFGLRRQMLRDSDEMQDLRWIGLDALSGVRMPRITQTILADVAALLQKEPSLPFGRPVPFYFMRHGRFVRSQL